MRASPTPPRLAMLLILLLAATIRFSSLDVLGYANHYYTAGVASMLQSWHNFYFAAAEPGGAVSIDKPPLGLWLQAVSALLLGVNGFAVVLPEIICGLLSLVVLYRLVGDRFGPAAGLLASLAMAVTPVVVATDRNNTMDSSLILVLLVAAWTFTRAAETGKRKILLLGVMLVGLAFNIKMLQAYLVLPAFYLVYLVGAPVRLRRKLADLTLATVVLLTVSLSWAVSVDLTPADQRPYVGSSTTNSELQLMLGHNGLNRLGEAGGGLNSLLQRLTAGGGPASAPPSGNPPPPPGRGGPPQLPAGALPPPNAPVQGPAGDGGQPDAPGSAPGGGPAAIGQPGALRLVTPPLSKEVSWLIPFALAGAVCLALASRPRWPVSPAHQALALWGGWLLVAGVFFSVAGLFHEYYLTMLGPPVGALTGAGVVRLWRLREARRWLAPAAFLAAAGCTLALQWQTARSFLGVPALGVSDAQWVVVAVAIFAAGAASVLISVVLRNRGLAAVGFVLVVAAMLVIPGFWSWLTAANGGGSQALPSAYSGRGAAPPPGSGLQVNRALLNFLQENTGSSKYLLAVSSANQGADFVLATGRPVLFVGGFSGQDRVVSADGLGGMVSRGELRYVYWPEAGAGQAVGAQEGQAARADISAWVLSRCRVVAGFGTAAIGPAVPAQPGGQRMSLYDCAR